MRPHLSHYWKIPPDGNAAFVARMEDVLEVYHLPYQEDFPVVCMDESSKQLIGEVHPPIPPAPGHGRLIDHEYVRHGTVQLFVEVEPLSGQLHVEVSPTRTARDWARFIKAMLDERYPNAVKVRLVIDNLNTHDIASLYATFAPAEARRLAQRLEIHYTPKHGSWLNIAEIELSALNAQCLCHRIADIQTMRRQINAWEHDRNHRAAPVNWQFTSQKARIKLTRLYPQL